VGLQIHLCADTLHTFGAFITNVTNVFNPPPDMFVFTSSTARIRISQFDSSIPKPKKRPTTISEQRTAKRGIMCRFFIAFAREDLDEVSIASVDEHAFRQVPDVGPAPDMINDDLPSNLDYLDVSFGTAAGLRELRDDDVDEFDLEDAEVGRVTPTQHSRQLGVVSNVGGETIKILRPLTIVEHHFDTLPHNMADGYSKCVPFYLPATYSS
jgi:autophagy-related protein 2